MTAILTLLYAYAGSSVATIPPFVGTDSVLETHLDDRVVSLPTLDPAGPRVSMTIACQTYKLSTSRTPHGIKVVQALRPFGRCCSLSLLAGHSMA